MKEFKHIGDLEFIKETGKALEALELGIKLMPVFKQDELVAVNVICGNKKNKVPVGTRSRLNIVKDIVDAL